MKKILIILSILIMLIIISKETNKIMIPENSIRIRVIANSNNIEDQVLKLKVKENVENKIYEKLENTKTIEEARNKIKGSLNDIDKIVNLTTNSNNYSIKYGNNYFPEKTLYGIDYKEGNYESLVINLGNGEGNNWWCVLFPPLCMIDVKENDLDNIEYKSKVLEILNDYN